MRKDSRLSFRISKSLSERVDKAIDKSGGQIRDRSEFGTKAVVFYLDYIENTQSEEEILLKSIVTLADQLNVSSREISKINKILDSRMMIPSTLSSKKTPESHPDFEKLLELRDKIDTEMQKEISESLIDVSYDDIEEIYRSFREKYYSEGRKQKKTKKIEA